MQVLGREGLGRYIDESMSLTQAFHRRAIELADKAVSTDPSGYSAWRPTHVPMTNLLTLRHETGSSSHDSSRSGSGVELSEQAPALVAQAAMHERGNAWVSV